MIKYVYPHLPSVKTFSTFRYEGSGLANCLYVFARAIVFAHENNLQLINPTWLNFAKGPWGRWEKDKRTYSDLFNPVGVSGLKKFVLLNSNKIVHEDNLKSLDCDAEIVRIFWMKTFDEIIAHSDVVRDTLLNAIKPNKLKAVNAFDFIDSIAVHVRLGDFSAKDRLPLSWYAKHIKAIHEQCPKMRFLLFSDGRDNELQEILSLPMVERVFFGSAISDIVAISRCKALISSHSTFSNWGGYLGQLPTLLHRQPHYGSFLIDKNKEFILGDENPVPTSFFEFLK